MRTLTKVALALASSVVLAEAPAQASPMDVEPGRLVLQPTTIAGNKAPFNTCQGIAAQPNQFAHSVYANQIVNGALPACIPDNDGWANMMAELGYAIAPSAFHPARTTGFGGFALSIEASYAHINGDNHDANGVQYWHAGTQGPTLPNGSFGTSNQTPDSILQIYTLKARKGLPFGFELAGALGYIANTTLWIGGADVHWALLEGYRTGILGYLPDISIGGGVRTLSGQSDFYLTTAGFDGQISKPLTLSDAAVLTPYVGAQRLITWANSANVNLAPNVDVLQVCGYGGVNQTTGAANCSNGGYGNAAYNDQTVFQKQTFYRWRGIAGVTYRYELLYLAGQFAFDLEDPSAENSNMSNNAAQPYNQPITLSGSRQWTFSLEAGVFF